jgi:signal peptidase I
MRWRNVKINPKNEKTKEVKKSSLPVRQGIKSEIIAWFWVGLAFMLINGTIGQARVIPSGSMKNTLLIGDHLIMSRIGYDAGVPFTNWHVPLWRNPHRQQMIIFKPPYAPDTTDLIKRTIGLPGDRWTCATAPSTSTAKNSMSLTPSDQPSPRHPEVRRAAMPTSNFRITYRTIVISQWATTAPILTTAEPGAASPGTTSSARP